MYLYSACKNQQGRIVFLMVTRLKIHIILFVIRLRRSKGNLSSVDNTPVVCVRSELSINTGQFAKSAAMVGNTEEHTSLSRALSQLAEIEERIDQLHMDQADADFFVLAELIKDYVGMVGAVKVRSQCNLFQ